MTGKRRRRNDSGWRADCLEARGHSCRNCGAGPVQMDHLIGRAQFRAGSVVENGVPLCSPFAVGSPFAGGCHQAKTDGKLRITRDMLDPDQLDWLEANGFARWDPETGEVSGLHMKIFADDRSWRGEGRAPAVGATR